MAAPFHFVAAILFMVMMCVSCFPSERRPFISKDANRTNRHAPPYSGVYDQLKKRGWPSFKMGIQDQASEETKRQTSYDIPGVLNNKKKRDNKIKLTSPRRGASTTIKKRGNYETERPYPPYLLEHVGRTGKMRVKQNDERRDDVGKAVITGIAQGILSALGGK